jgi:hypothetical protein
MQIEIPPVAGVGLPIAGVLGLTTWMIRKYGIGTAMSSVLLLLGTLTLCTTFAGFAAKLFAVASLGEDAIPLLGTGATFGTFQLVASALAIKMLPPPPVEPQKSDPVPVKDQARV